MYETKRINISLIVFTYFLLRFIDPFFHPSRAYILLFTLVEAIPFLWFLLNRPSLRLTSFAVIFLGLFSIWLSMVAADEVYVSEMVFTILGIWMGYHLSEEKMDQRWAFRLFVIFTVTILIRFLITKSPDYVFLTTSRNAISTYMILSAVLFYSTCEERKSVPLLPAIITFLVSCLGEGRGGVLSSFLLLFGILVYNAVFVEKMPLKHVFVFALMILAGLFLYTRYFDLIFSRAVQRLTSERLLENERVMYAKEYFAYMGTDIRLFLFGIPAMDLPSIAYLGGNFHNSFFSLHSMSGITGCLIIFVLVFRACIHSLCNKKWIPLLLLFVVLFRSLTDELCFVGLYDPLFYYLVFLCLNCSSAEGKGEESVAVSQDVIESRPQA